MKVLILALVLEVLSSIVLADIIYRRAQYGSDAKKENDDANNIFISRHMTIGKSIFPNTAARLLKTSKSRSAPIMEDLVISTHNGIKPMYENARKGNDNLNTAAEKFRTQISINMAPVPVNSKMPAEENKISSNDLRYNENPLPNYSHQSLKQSSNTFNRVNNYNVEKPHHFHVKLLPKSIVPKTRGTKRFYKPNTDAYITEVENVDVETGLLTGFNDIVEAPTMLNSWEK